MNSETEKLLPSQTPLANTPAREYATQATNKHPKHVKKNACSTITEAVGR
jgi:hypothetical protein